MTAADWPEVRAIYEAGIATGHATFETTAPSWERWDGGHLPDHRLVTVAPDGRLAAWASLSAVSDRRERIGQLHGTWRDTLFLERRSSTVGVPPPAVEPLT